MIVAARSIHFAAAMLLFGGLVFATLVASPLWRGHGTTGAADLGSALLAGAWTLAVSIVAGVFWFVAEAAVMSGLPLMQAINADTLGVVLGRTLFGQIWMCRLIVAIVLGALLLAIGRRGASRSIAASAVAAALVSAVYLATLVWSGHAAVGEASDSYVQIASDAVHLLAAGAWVGGLPGLVFVLNGSQPQTIVVAVVRRFSTLGVVCVSALALSGFANGWYLVGDVPGLVGTGYGRLLLVKIALFAAMVGVAAFNRWSLTERLSAAHPAHRHAERTLRRNASIELGLGMIVVAIVGQLGVLVPAAHQSAVWPFDHTLSWLAVAQSLSGGTIVIVASIVAAAGFAASLLGAARRRWRIAMLGVLAVGAGAATAAKMLAVPAYPTTYAMPPIPYTTDSIVRGAALYAQNCSACHGPLGRGDGPAAASLEILPTDLAAHATSHRAGELFWWIAHGFPGTPMPAFAPSLSDAEIWDLAQFLRAQSDAFVSVGLTNRVQPWRYVIAAPDFTFEVAGKGQQSLRQPKTNPITLLVLYAVPQSLPYLRALAAEADAFNTIGLRVIAITQSSKSEPSSATHPPDGELEDSSSSIAGDANLGVAAAYSMFARQEIGRVDSTPAQAEYLIDRNGYVRARWIGVPDSPSARAADVFDQAQVLGSERQRAPHAAGHVHY